MHRVEQVHQLQGPRTAAAARGITAIQSGVTVIQSGVTVIRSGITVIRG